jgi:hypothetical protein
MLLFGPIYYYLPKGLLKGRFSGLFKGIGRLGGSLYIGPLFKGTGLKRG